MKSRGYHFFRSILGPIFRFYYNPKILNKENIPEEGPIIIVGNHIHIMDQCPVIVSTNRIINYMAKKEYFEGKFAWFFRLTGCISVDRTIRDTEAKNEALEVLKNNGAVGLFPEGTRNSLKEEKIKELYKKYNSNNLSYKRYSKLIKRQKTSQINYLEKLADDKKITIDDINNNIFNVDSYLKELVSKKIIKKSDYEESRLLPLKFGTVSMAQKTNATIIPFGIKGTYCFRSKNLTVTFGKPFKINNMELDEANKKLEKVIRDLTN